MSLPMGNKTCCHNCDICLTHCKHCNDCSGACAGCPHPCWADLSGFREAELKRQRELRAKGLLK